MTLGSSPATSESARVSKVGQPGPFVIGGSAARLAQDHIRKVECLDFPEFGMEAVWRIEVENFPAFIVTDYKGNYFFGT